LAFDYIGKVCTKCRTWKLLDQFPKQPTGRLGRMSQCKECRNIALRKWRAKIRVTPEHEQLYAQGLKRCTKCKQILPLAEFSKNKDGRYGYAFHCKKCKHQRYRKYNPLDPQIAERKTLGAQGLKRCTECNQIKPLTEFRRAPKGSYGRASKCKECRATYAYAYRQKHPDKVRAQKQRWIDENRDKKNIRAREWYVANREKERVRSRKYHAVNREKERVRSRKYRIENPEKRRISNCKWEAKNPDKIRAKGARRRTRKTNAGGSFTDSEWQELCEKYDNCCLCCGEAKPLEPDHIVSVSKGGHSNISNIQPLCRSCNASKGTKTIDYR
jgi:hypothetical protein